MYHPVLVTLENKEKVIINLGQICTVERMPKYTLVSMSNGRELLVINPSWEEWDNDLYKKN